VWAFRIEPAVLTRNLHFAQNYNFVVLKANRSPEVGVGDYMKKKFYQKKPVAIFIIVVLLGLFTWVVMDTFENMGSESTKTKVKLETSKGDMIIELYSDMPITAGNFEKLVSEGYYDGIIFHRVIPNFMIQGGDPTGTGTGGPGYTIDDEFVAGHSNLRGTLSMANSGPNSGGSQFFINLVDNTFLDYDNEPLTSKHPVFGEVVEGLDVLDAIGGVATGAQDKPIEEIKIIRATII